MPSRMVVTLSDSERQALRQIAKRDLRGMNEQARYLLRRVLEQQGLLPDSKQGPRRHEEHLTERWRRD